MRIKSLIDEDFVNYKKPAMFIAMPQCSFKCDKENGCQLCQNAHLANQKGFLISTSTLIERYLNNQITEAIVFGGLEPFDTAEELLSFVIDFRKMYECRDDIVIYTGYNEEELTKLADFQNLVKLGNIVVKFGRFRPNQSPHYDPVLGVNLASDNQYAKRY